MYYDSLESSCYIGWKDLTPEEQDEARYKYVEGMNSMYGMTAAERRPEAVDAALAKMDFARDDEGDIDIIW